MLDHHIQDFIAYKQNYGAAESTTDTYSRILADFLKCVGNIDINNLTILVIDKYSRAVFSRDYKSKTTHNKLAIVRSFIRYLYARNLSDIRPEAVELPRVIETESNFLSPAEQVALLSVIKSARDRAIIHTMLSSGLRVSELLSLLYDDLYDKSLVVRCGKGGKPRITFITDQCSRDISTYLATKPRTSHLFTNHWGELISRQYVARIVSEYARAAGIEKTVSPHTLRHSFATNMLRNGARIEVVQKLMGHAKIQTTLIYMHFTNPYLQSEYEKFSTARPE